jgi:DNA-binding transcriptional regulator YbjK
MTETSSIDLAPMMAAEKRYRAQRDKLEEALAARDAAVMEVLSQGASQYLVAKTMELDKQMIRKIVAKTAGKIEGVER